MIQRRDSKGLLWKPMRLVMSVGAAVALGGCGGAGGIRPPAQTLTLESNVRGIRVVAPVDSGVIGTLSVKVESSRLTVTLNTTGLTNVTAADVHAGAFGTNGPVIFKLYAAVDGPFPAILTKVLTAADLQPQPGVGIRTFEDALRVVRNGDAYVDVHTQAHPDGEVRGQIGQDEFLAILSGVSEVPLVNTPARGDAVVRIDATQGKITITLDLSNLRNVTSINIHAGAYGEIGPVIFNLYSASQGPLPGRLNKILTSADLQPAPASGINNFSDAMAALRSREAITYINVTTEAHPTGEIRGQIFENSVGSPAFR